MKTFLLILIVSIVTIFAGHADTASELQASVTDVQWEQINKLLIEQRDALVAAHEATLKTMSEKAKTQDDRVTDAVQRETLAIGLMKQFRDQIKAAMEEEKKTGEGPRYETYTKGLEIIEGLIAEAEKPTKQRELDELEARRKALDAEIAAKKADQ